MLAVIERSKVRHINYDEVKFGKIAPGDPQGRGETY
tara:strand:- start:423 stop:530 length:108 start_codon:yes stop_codon:yes gene_type:complete